MFLSRFPRSSPGNFGGGYHGNRWIPGTTLLPAEPPPPSSSPPSLPPSCPHVHWGERAETFCLFEQFPLDFWRNALQLRWLKQIPIRCVLGFFFFFPWENQFRLTSFRPSVTVHMIHRAAVDTRRADKTSVRYLKVLKVTDCDFKPFFYFFYFKRQI